jgi:hypothetical protein
MKKAALRVVLLGAGLAGLAMAGMAQTDSKVAGHWEGKIQMPKRDLGITVDLGKNPTGAWIGSMSVAGSSAKDVPLDDIAVEDTNVRFTSNLPESVFFEGHPSADSASLSGTASTAAGGVPFQLTRTGEANVKVPPPSTVLSREFAGSWEGSHEVNGKARRVGLKLWTAANGAAAATLTAGEQGEVVISVTTVTIQGKDLRLEARAVSGTYHGTLSAEGEIAGEWSEETEHFPLTFKRVSIDTKQP